MGRAWLIGFTSAIGFTATMLTAAACFASEQFAAEELARYSRQITGNEAFAGKVTMAVKPTDGESFTITTDGERIDITASNDFMLLAGMYDLLDRAGCKFLAPDFAQYDGAAEVVPKLKIIAPKLGSPLARKPRLKFRKLYVEEGHSHDLENLKQLIEWMPKVGYNTLVIPTDYQGSGRVKWDNWREQLTPELQKRGITIEVGGHGYQNFLSAEMEGGKIFEQHLEWFARNAQGKPQKAKQWVFCTSNSEAVRKLTDNFLAYIKARPEIQIFDFWPPDGAKWCECDACKRLGEPADRQAILLKQVQEAVKPVRPDLRLEIIAYSSYLEPPKDVAVDKNVVVDFCPISQHFDAQINDPANKNKTYADALTAWRKNFKGDISIYSYYRKYAWDSLPVVIPHYMQRDLQWYATLPTQGVSVYSEPGDWFTYELNHYVLAALAWDPDVDVDAVVQKFCDARYRDQAGVAKSTFDALERTIRIYGSVPNVPLKDADGIAKAKAELRSAINRIAIAADLAQDQRVRQSLERLALTCAYGMRDLEIQHLRATNASREQIVAKAKDLHAWVKSHADEGVFLVKDQRLNQNRMLSRYGVGEAKRAAATEPE